MAIRVDAYTSGGVASGYLATPEPLRETLEGPSGLPLSETTWLELDDLSTALAGVVTIPADEVLVALGDDESSIPVHATWHHISLDAGPYQVEGELPTLPGFDPGRALTRPSGEFVMLRDVRLTIREQPDAGEAVGAHALVNRYGVERIRADIMLGFFFPGAAIEGLAPVGAVAAS